VKKERANFLKPGRIRNISHYFIAVGDVLLHFTPYLSLQIKQAGIDKEYNISPREYLAVCFVSSMITAVMIGAVVTLALNTGTGQFLKFGPIIGAITGILMYIQKVSYPKSIVGRRVKDLERNLLFALRTILVQVRSGVPIFDSFVSIATGNYGQIAEEFKKVIEKARSGQPVLETLEEMAVRNPSPYFRRAIWQIVNAIKSGSDIGENLECVIDSLSKEQMVQIREYKSILNPLAMMYMMIAVIIPSLGITVMIIISTFPGMGKLGEQNTFWMLLGGVIIMQFMFMSIIRAKRPNLIG
jgi:flagellar protein FlaJ